MFLRPSGTGLPMTSSDIAKIVSDRWTGASDFGFTELRKSAHTAHSSSKYNDEEDLLCMGQGHTLQTAKRHYILETADSAVKYSELLDSLLSNIFSC